jgi:outer membrane translocation and assembly module TamA
MLPTVGGRDMLRGFRQGMYRQNVMLMAQTEYRLPIYKRLKAAFFCSAGDVVNSYDYKSDKLKIAYGAGLRYRLNDARVHLRLDFARNNYGDKLQFYITATEAF